MKSEVQLAELAGCEMAFDPLAQQWLPQADEDGRALKGSVYLAGDGAGVAGADAAELRGRLAALALLADKGIADGARGCKRGCATKLRRIMRFRNALERALPAPFHLARSLPDETVICRCEAITAGDIRQGQLTRTGGNEPGQGFHPRRHGPLPGPRMRPRRGSDSRRCARMQRWRRSAACAARRR